MGTVKKQKLRLKAEVKKKLLAWYNLVILLSYVLSALFVVFVIRLDMVPHKYIVLFAIFVFLIHLLILFFFYFKKKIVFKVLGGIFLFLSIGLSSLGIYYVNHTQYFMDHYFSEKEGYIKNTYYVLVKASSNIIKEKISGTIGVYEEMDHLDEAVQKLSSKYSVDIKEYNDIGVLFDSLNNDTEQILLLEKTSYELVFSISEALKREDYTVIYEYDIYTPTEAKETGNTKKFNIYVGGKDFAGFMDFNMIVTVNSETHTVLLTNIPRDFYIPVWGKGGRKDKLSFMKVYGEDVAKNSLSEYFETPLDYKVMIDTSSLVTVVDYIGGIEFCSNYEYTTTHALVQGTYNDFGKKKLHVVKGCQHFNGIETLTVARERKAFPGSDQVRQENCQKILLAILKKLMSTDTLIRYHDTLKTLGSLYQTDLPVEFINQTAKDILNNGNQWKIETQMVEGNDTKGRVYLSNLIDWVMVPKEETVVAAKERINQTLS